jgi:Family of unknown function (DUF5691)
MNASRLHATVLPSLLGGTSRHPLPAESGPDSALAMFSLMGQALRFERPATPESFMVEAEIKDDRKILSDRLRRPLVRLLAAKANSDHAARALARQFERLRLRPHPFDLPSLDSFARTHAEKLGPTAQQWVGRQRTDAPTQSYFDPERLDESNWTQAALSRRAAYLEQRRQEDPDAARGLVESNWAQEEADARFRLLHAFQTRLGMADEPFLSSLEKDRAPRVRALAARLLARLGTGGSNPALAVCLDRIKRGQSGLLRKRPTLQLELPANVKEQAASRRILQTFSDVSAGELAGALQMPEREMTEAATKDEPMLLALALMATNDRRLDLLELAVEKLPNAWERMFESGLDSLGTMTDPERERWQEIIAGPYGKEPPANYLVWDWLHRITDRELPASVMPMVFQLKVFTEGENVNAIGPWLEVVAALCAQSERQQLRDRLSRFDPSQNVAPLALLDILDGMENDHAHV